MGRLPSSPHRSGSGSTSPLPNGPQSALPSLTARILAFLAIALGGACGGFIGYAFGSLADFGPTATGLITLVGGLGCAIGVAVIAVLTLRALGEWHTLRDNDTGTT